MTCSRLIPFLLSLFLAACGGGGGGGSGGGGGNPYLVSEVPYYTPTRVASVDIASTPTNQNTVADIFTKDLTGTGAENVVIAGRSSTSSSQITVMGWQNGQLVNQTSQWFSGTDNVIRGTEPSVKFGDFLGDGKQGIYVAPSTDNINVYGSPGVVFINNGTSFTRVNLNLGNVWAHDSVVHDFNNDGKADIFTADYGPNSSIAFSNGNGTFNIATNNPVTSALRGNSGVAVGDFLNNGSTQFIFTDTDVTALANTKLMSYTVVGNDLNFQVAALLPVARFDLPKWSSYNFGNGGIASHSVRALAFDFDNSGMLSAVIFSRPAQTNGQWPLYSEVQFLKNNGGGVFTDVTDNVLVGYNTATPVTYNPKLIDINGDGLTDILLGGTSWSSANNVQVLVHTREHKYVASYANVFTAFENQAFNAEAVRSAAVANSNITNMVVGPNNELYLVTLVDTFEGGVNKKAVYLSKIGAQTITAQATATAIRQAWPYMSPAQVNDVLARTSATYLGFNVIDAEKALSPIGKLGTSVTGSRIDFSGYIAGLNLGGMNKSVLFDELGRPFNVNLASTSFNAPNLWGRYAENIVDDTRGAQPNKMMQFTQIGNLKFGGDQQTQTFSFGVTGVNVSKRTSLSAQYTQLPFSPFVQIAGSWGTVKKSNILEVTATTKQNGWVGKTGVMYSNTQIEPGLVTKIDPITSVWGEVGYEFEKVKVFAGMLPKVVGGSANIRMPVGIDNAGNQQYNNVKANVINDTTQYLRASYTERFSKAVSFSLNTMVTDRKQNSIYGEFKIRF